MGDEASARRGAVAVHAAAGEAVQRGLGGAGNVRTAHCKHTVANRGMNRGSAALM